MCENQCEDCFGCGDETGLDNQLLIEFNKIVGYLTIITDRIDAIEKKQRKLKKLLRRICEDVDLPEDLGVPEELVDSIEKAFVEDFLGKRDAARESNTSSNTSEVKPTVTLTKSAPVVTAGKPIEGKPNTVTVTVTKTTKPTNKPPTNPSGIMYSITEFLAVIGLDMIQDKRNKFVAYMTDYTKNTSDVRIRPDGVASFSKKSLKEGLKEFLF